MESTDGALALPVMAIASYPAALSEIPNLPPLSASPQIPVNGDFAATA
jgi:hypothetical protein